MEKFAKEFRGTVQKVEKAEKALLKEFGDYLHVSRYFETKRNRFNELQHTLNMHYMEFKVFALPYKDKPWAKSLLGNVQEALKRVNVISTRIPKHMDDLWYDMGRLPIAGAYDQFIGVNKNLDTFLSTALALAKALNLVIKVELDLPALRGAPQLPLPYLLSIQQTFAVSWKKLRRELGSGHWRVLPRQLFSYFFVDSVWMYRKAWRKCRAIAEIV